MFSFRRVFFALLSVLASLTQTAGASAPEPAADTATAATWTPLPALPDREGFASAFAGVSGDALLVAGGANFPDKRPWDGGAKVWYDDVFVLAAPDGAWRVAGKLPGPNAYGVSFSVAGGVVCAGGGDARAHSREVLLLTWNGRDLKTKVLPALPAPSAFGSGAAMGERLFLVGGIERPDSTQAAGNFWMLDLSEKNPAWRGLPALPGPARMLAQVGVIGETFYVCGGVALHAGADGKPVRTYLKDNYAYDAATGWRKLADMPHAVAAAPSPMAVTAAKTLLVVSGDDGTRAHLAGPNHPGFLQEVLVYDPSRDAWSVAAEEAPISRATAPTVVWRGAWTIASGEKKPGYRSPEVWSWRSVR